MRAEVVLPDLGVTTVCLSAWFADVGEMVYEGDRLVEVLLEGATFDISAPATGQFIEKCALPDDKLHIGQVLGVVEGESTRH